MREARKDLVNSLIIVAFCGIAYSGILEIPVRGAAKTEADFFPKIIVGLLFVLAIFLLVKSIYGMIKQEKRDNKKERVDWQRLFKENSKVIYTFAIFSVYIFLLQGIGYFISSVIFLFALYLILMPGKKRYITGIIGSVLITVLLFVVFRYGLSVYLPEGKWL
ncbi:tripartite tricarboxylate transporter TctB family protein [Sporosarcina jiandibaonis]|uniref:tripartite tricarboxylate transporter TctB family protein n=1 Tax=Sporosarcina jiandibaonis TaxID=2715535 RepID=UPI0015562319|nr:tripartite tricarboxylate transporter TctB family protein [Sporosarcina jiandibaonis]